MSKFKRKHEIYYLIISASIQLIGLKIQKIIERIFIERIFVVVFSAYLEETRMRLENAKNQLYERTFATTTEQPPRIVTPTSKRPPVDTSTGKIPHTNHPINT